MTFEQRILNRFLEFNEFKRRALLDAISDPDSNNWMIAKDFGLSIIEARVFRQYFTVLYRTVHCAGLRYIPGGKAADEPLPALRSSGFFK